MPTFPKLTRPHSAASEWFLTEGSSTRFLRRVCPNTYSKCLGEPEKYLLIETDPFFMKCSYNLILTIYLPTFFYILHSFPKIGFYLTWWTAGEFLKLIPKHKELRHSLHSSRGYCILGYCASKKYNRILCTNSCDIWSRRIPTTIQIPDRKYSWQLK